MEFGRGRWEPVDSRRPEIARDAAHPHLKVKFRESFRPFAPAVLREDVADWFEFEGDSPYMLIVAGVRPERRRQMTESESALFGIEKLNVRRSDIPAVTHIDYSARIQTVHEETNQRFHKLLVEFKRLTGVGVLVNTSFTCAASHRLHSAEALRCFLAPISIFWSRAGAWPTKRHRL